MKAAIGSICVFGVATMLLICNVASAANGPADGPRVCVEYLETGWRFPLHVNLNGTVRQVKELIQRLSMYHVSPARQQLMFDGQLLDDKRALQDYNISRHSELGLAIDMAIADDEIFDKNVVSQPQTTGPKPATLSIWTPGTITFTIDVDLTDTVGTLKKRILKQEEYPVAQQALYCGAAVMKDSRTLESYGLANGGFLTLMAPITWCDNKKLLSE